MFCSSPLQEGTDLAPSWLLPQIAFFAVRVHSLKQIQMVLKYISDSVEVRCPPPSLPACPVGTRPGNLHIAKQWWEQLVSWSDFNEEKQKNEFLVTNTKSWNLGGIRAGEWQRAEVEVETRVDSAWLWTGESVKWKCRGTWTGKLRWQKQERAHQGLAEVPEWL